jgi:hypothetical protein
MAKKHLPWEEIVLWSLLGGVFAVGMSWVGLTAYRWAWDDQALLQVTGDRQNIYALAVCGIGALVTAVVLALGGHRDTRPGTPNKDKDKGRRR